MENVYYVYHGFVNGELVYIGKGKGNRINHLNSGVSHCYEANKAHFSGEIIEVEKVIEGLTEEDALSIEADQIDNLNPLWNKQNTFYFCKETKSYRRLPWDDIDALEEYFINFAKSRNVSVRSVLTTYSLNYKNEDEYKYELLIKLRNLYPVLPSVKDIPYYNKMYLRTQRIFKTFEKKISSGKQLTDRQKQKHEEALIWKAKVDDYLAGKITAKEVV